MREDSVAFDPTIVEESPLLRKTGPMTLDGFHDLDNCCTKTHIWNTETDLIISTELVVKIPYDARLTELNKWVIW